MEEENTKAAGSMVHLVVDTSDNVGTHPHWGCRSRSAGRGRRQQLYPVVDVVHVRVTKLCHVRGERLRNQGSDGSSPYSLSQGVNLEF
jgi:hypothetical protein